MLLEAGSTCWRVEKAQRAALLIDVANYFSAAKASMFKAQRSIHLLNWAFDPDTLFEPRPGGVGPQGDRIGPFLKHLAQERPKLDLRVLCWRSALPVAATQRFFPHRAKQCFAGTRVHFVLDSKLPMGACHHQKMIIVDDAVAFCGGADIGPDRWDTPAHADDDSRRCMSRADHRCFDSRHEVMSVVDGAAASALGDLFRDRWRRATGEQLEASKPTPPSAWPACVEPEFANATIGVSRSAAAWRGFAEIRETEALHLCSIAAAKRCIYLENQYFTSPVIAEALAARLSEPRGPEVIIVSTQHSPSWFDRMTMDRTRSMFLKRLQAADIHGRLRAYAPVTSLGRIIIVHAKLSIIDDVLLRIGSANLNNRSGGFDTECDLSIQATGRSAPADRKTIAELRTTLLAHWLGCETAVMQDALDRLGSVGEAIETLRGGGRCRLRPIAATPIGPLATFIATFHLGDPSGPEDAWRPWKRRSQLRRDLAALSRTLKKAGQKAPSIPRRVKVN